MAKGRMKRSSWRSIEIGWNPGEEQKKMIECLFAGESRDDMRTKSVIEMTEMELKGRQKKT